MDTTSTRLTGIVANASMTWETPAKRLILPFDSYYHYQKQSIDLKRSLLDERLKYQKR